MVDRIIHGYPFLMKLRGISLDIGHPISCLMEMSIIVVFILALRFAFKKIRNEYKHPQHNTS